MRELPLKRTPDWQNILAPLFREASFSAMSNLQSSSSYNCNKLHPIPGVQLSRGKFRRRQGFTVVFHHDTSWKELLRQQEVMHVRILTLLL